MGNATLNSINLGIVKNESSTKDSNLFNMPMPYSDSSDAFLIDIMGTSRTINITGEVVGTKQELINFIINIEAIQNGQQSGSTYTGELITKDVQIQTFNWDYQEGDVSRLHYTLNLIEGKSY